MKRRHAGEQGDQSEKDGGDTVLQNPAVRDGVPLHPRSSELGVSAAQARSEPSAGKSLQLRLLPDLSARQSPRGGTAGPRSRAREQSTAGVRPTPEHAARAPFSPAPFHVLNKRKMDSKRRCPPQNSA